MISTFIAYALIFIALAVYGVTLYRRTREVNDALKREDK
jgi:hypothetical protein